MSRFQLGVRVTGTVNKLPYRALYPISVGEGVLGNSARANLATGGGSGRVALIGFAVFVGFAVLLGIVTALFARL